MDRKNKLLLLIPIFLGVIVIALLLVYIFVPAPDRSAEPISASLL